MRRLVPYLCILLSALLLIPLQKAINKDISGRTIQEKLGYIPSRQAMKILSLDHKPLAGDWLFFKVMTYYGGKIDPSFRGSGKVEIEFPNMYRFLDVVTELDPYNIDAYYFTEAVFTWGIGRIKEVNRILEKGLRYRKWDFYIPFFLGFNYFYFLKDYENASRYLKITAEITKNPFYVSLASRMIYEAQRTELAIAFLKGMIEETWNEAVKKTLMMRLKAFEGVLTIERAIEDFEQRFGRRAVDINDLVKTGLLKEIPKDPYGGIFYIDKEGRVRSTSNFAGGKRD